MAKGKEVLQWLIDGKKIRNVKWINETGYLVLRDNQLLEEHNVNAHGYWDFFINGWELFEEPAQEDNLEELIDDQDYLVWDAHGNRTLAYYDAEDQCFYSISNCGAFSLDVIEWKKLPSKDD